jgi:Ca2+-binding RTX toxin-like protein
MCNGQVATILGTTGDDTLPGTAGDDVIVGRGGDDVISGRGGTDNICGGLGNDRLRGGSGKDQLFGGGDADVLRGGRGSDGTQDGGEGNDRIFGESGGRNDLYPGPGDDVITGSPTVYDWLHLEAAPGPVDANLMTGVIKGDGTDTVIDVETVLGGAFNDTLVGNEEDNGLVGRAGNDTLIGNGGHDTMSGQQGSDTYSGGPGFDVAEYFDQNTADGLPWGPMNVNLRTGIATGDGTDALTSIEGATGSDLGDTMIGNRKNNSFFWLFGGFDVVKAGGGDDFVESSQGANDLAGGKGSDFVIYLDGRDFDHQHSAVAVDLAAGTSSTGDTLSGFENVFGSPHRDLLRGDGVHNLLYGWLGDDVLKGRGGDDRLIGDAGADKGYGGPGIDRCRTEQRTACEITPGKSRGEARIAWFVARAVRS